MTVLSCHLVLLLRNIASFETFLKLTLKCPFEMNATLLSRCILKHHTKFLLLRRVTEKYTRVSASNCLNITSNYSTSERDKCPSVFEICKRLLSSDSGPPKKLPPLTNFPEIVWPSLIKSIRNFILTTFIIKPYMDREFNIPEFVRGSKKAVELVSRRLAEGDLKSLDGLVTSEILPNIHKSVSLMSLTQREQLSVKVEDIYFSFPYQVGIIFNDEEGKDHKRFVEVTMVYHTMRGLSAMRSRGEEPPLNMGMLPEYQGRISVCNYRFVREFTKGVDGSWTINLLNHFKPADYLD